MSSEKTFQLEKYSEKELLQSYFGSIQRCNEIENEKRRRCEAIICGSDDENDDNLKMRVTNDFGGGVNRSTSRCSNSSNESKGENELNRIRAQNVMNEWRELRMKNTLINDTSVSISADTGTNNIISGALTSNLSSINDAATTSVTAADTTTTIHTAATITTTTAASAPASASAPVPAPVPATLSDYKGNQFDYAFDNDDSSCDEDILKPTNNTTTTSAAATSADTSAAASKDAPKENVTTHHEVIDLVSSDDDDDDDDNDDDDGGDESNADGHKKSSNTFVSTNTTTTTTHSTLTTVHNQNRNNDETMEMDVARSDGAKKYNDDIIVTQSTNKLSPTTTSITNSTTTHKKNNSSNENKEVNLSQSNSLNSGKNSIVAITTIPKPTTAIPKPTTAIPKPTTAIPKLTAASSTTAIPNTTTAMTSTSTPTITTDKNKTIVGKKEMKSKKKKNTEKEEKKIIYKDDLESEHDSSSSDDSNDVDDSDFSCKSNADDDNNDDDDDDSQSHIDSSDDEEGSFHHIDSSDDDNDDIMEFDLDNDDNSDSGNDNDGNENDSNGSNDENQEQSEKRDEKKKSNSEQEKEKDQEDQNNTKDVIDSRCSTGKNEEGTGATKDQKEKEQQTQNKRGQEDFQTKERAMEQKEKEQQVQNERGQDDHQTEAKPISESSIKGKDFSDKRTRSTSFVSNDRAEEAFKQKDNKTFLDEQNKNEEEKMELDEKDENHDKMDDIVGVALSSVKKTSPNVIGDKIDVMSSKNNTKRQNANIRKRSHSQMTNRLNQIESNKDVGKDNPKQARKDNLVASYIEDEGTKTMFTNSNGMVINSKKFQDMSQKFYDYCKRTLQISGNADKNSSKDNEAKNYRDYDAHLTPMKNIGLGIMLCNQYVIAFVRQSASTPMLPGERCGKIVPGDRLISVNDKPLHRKCHGEILNIIAELLKANTKSLHFKFRKINQNRTFIDEYFKKWSTKEQIFPVTDRKSSEQDTPSNESILVNSSPLLRTEDSVQYARNNGDGVKLSERSRGTIDSSSLVAPKESLQYKLMDPDEKELLQKLQIDINKSTISDLNSENILESTVISTCGGINTTMGITNPDEKELLQGIEMGINKDMRNDFSPRKEIAAKNRTQEQEVTHGQKVIMIDDINIGKEVIRGTKRRLNDLEALDKGHKSPIIKIKDNKKLTPQDSINLHALQVKSIHEEGDKVKAKSSLKGGKGWYHGTVKSRQSSKPLDERYGPVYLYSIQFQDGQTDLNVHEVNVVKLKDFNITDEEMKTFGIVNKKDRESKDKYARSRGWYCISGGDEYFSSVSDALKMAQANKK